MRAATVYTASVLSSVPELAISNSSLMKPFISVNSTLKNVMYNDITVYEGLTTAEQINRVADKFTDIFIDSEDTVNISES